jgi:ornithine cyclodeaminase/alanine dehydrogenase
MGEVIEAVEEGFRAISLGHVTTPDRIRLDVIAHHGVFLEMPALANLDGAGALGTKIVSVFEHNQKRGLASVQAIYILFDSETGIPLSLMDGKFITAIRTAATSAVATKFMSPPGSKSLAVFGAGVQAEFHIDAMFEVIEVEQVLIASRSEEKARALNDRIRSARKIAVDVVSAEQAAGANLICTCTSSGVPLFDGSKLLAGTHINAVGAFTPSTRELDTETVRRARVIIDSESAAGREAGELLIPISEGAIDPNHVKGNLAEVVSGRVAGRASAAEVTVFKSCGLAIEDLVTARLAYTRAIARAIGTNIEL